MHVFILKIQKLTLNLAVNDLKDERLKTNAEQLKKKIKKKESETEFTLF